MKVFHSGDMGDVIYAIPALKDMGCKHILLNTAKTFPTKMGEKEANFLKPLLEHNGFKVEIDHYVECPNGYFNGDKWRYSAVYSPSIHLSILQAKLLNIVRFDDELKKPFLKKYKPLFKEKYCVLFSSGKYRNPDMDYSKVIRSIPEDLLILFFGLDEEFVAFVSNLDEDVQERVTPYDIEDLNVAAQIIEYADIVAGNQTVFYAIAEGLKSKRILEVCLWQPNCVLPEPDIRVFYFKDKENYDKMEKFIKEYHFDFN